MFHHSCFYRDECLTGGAEGVREPLKGPIGAAMTLVVFEHRLKKSKKIHCDGSRRKYHVLYLSASQTNT